MSEKIPGQVDWRAFTDDKQIEEKLKELVREVGISSLESRKKSEEEVADTIKNYIASKGFPGASDIALAVSTNSWGDKMVMGMAHSPLTGETVHF